MTNENYPLYNPMKVCSVREMVVKSADTYDDKTAFRYQDDSGNYVEITFNEVKEHVMNLGTALYNIGIQNKKIAILGENSYSWILAFFAITSGNNIAIPIDKELSVKAIETQLKDCECDVLIYSSTYLDTIDELKKDSLVNMKYISMDEIEELLVTGKDAISNGVREYLDYVVDIDAVAEIVYTSGTTGVSKGVMLSNYNMAYNTYGSCQTIAILGDTLLVLPLHHTYGLLGVFITLINGYCTNINRSIRRFSSDLITYKPDKLFLVPLFVETLYKNIWRAAEGKGMTEGLKKLIEVSNEKLENGIDERRELLAPLLASLGGNLDMIISGGAPLSPKYIQGFREIGINLLNGYGITECSPVVSVNRNNYYRDGSVGQVLNRCEVDIRNKDGNGYGEIWVKGPIVMKGYYNRPEETALVMDDGWFNTGDIGYVDEDGFLFLTGRKKNLIILANGENVAPEELEELLSDISLISEVIVSEKDNRIHAEILPNLELVEKEDIKDVKKVIMEEISKINRTLPSYKQIDEISLRDKEFAKTTTKKIKRGELK